MNAPSTRTQFFKPSLCNGPTLHVCGLMKYANSVLIGVRRGRINRSDAEEFLRSLHDLNIQLTDPVSYDDVFKLSEIYGLTFYDASYRDLALREGASLASLDDALVVAAGKAGVLLFEPRRMG